VTWLRGLVDRQDVKGIQHYLRSRLLRNLGGIGNKELYAHLRAGSKALIEDYTSEVVRALQFLCVVDTPDLSDQQKLAFFDETRHAFGRTALLLSGGATLGVYHLGVIRALVMNNLLPRIISGSSVGSLIAAIAGTRTDEELCRLDQKGSIELTFFPTQTGSISRRLKRFFESGANFFRQGFKFNSIRGFAASDLPILSHSSFSPSFSHLHRRRHGHSNSAKGDSRQRARSHVSRGV
jgi:TAG lipase/lysophosphatidylethanolamine acyltransferase